MAELLGRLRNFGLGPSYSFIAGVFVSFALGTVAEVRLAQAPIPDTSRFYSSSFLAFVAAAFFWYLSVLLEEAKSEWIAEGANPDRGVIADHLLRCRERFNFSVAAAIASGGLSVYLFL